MKHVLFLLFFCALPFHATAQERWLTALSDTLFLDRLSIPGAHNAATASIRGMGRCQALTLAEQLRVGVRAFDLRPTQDRRLRWGGTEAKGLGDIYHGLKDTNVSLADAFADFNAFLEANPGECVIVILRDESDGRYLFAKPKADTFIQSLRDFLKSQPRVADFSPALRLSACRGRILVLCRTGSPANMVSTYVSWSHNVNGSKDRRVYYAAEASVPLAVQDCYSPKVAGLDDEAFLNKKVAVAESFLDDAATAAGVLFVNHASAYVGTKNYCRNAAWVNSRLCQYIEGKSPHIETGRMKADGPTGILMMDFVGVEEAKYRGKTYRVCGNALLHAVIANNF